MARLLSGRWVRWLVGGLVAVAVFVVVADRATLIVWAGGVDLNVVFAVSDAETGAPVSGAVVCVQEGEEWVKKSEFELTAGEHGPIQRECRQVMCSGRQSWLGIVNTFSVKMPPWNFRVVAEGYESGEWAELPTLACRRDARLSGFRKAEVVVPVRLRRVAEKPA